MYRGAIVDVDGTLVRGDTLLPGAEAAFEALERADIAPVLLSNNPTRDSDHYRDVFDGTAIDVDTIPVLTSATITASALQDRHPAGRIFLVGDPRLERIFIDAGLSLTTDPDDADLLVASIDPAFSYDTLRDTQRALERDIPYYGTDPDPRIPGPNGPVPGTGTILAALEAAAGRPADAVFGKPSTAAANAALDALGVPAETVIVVGDRRDTDVALGERAGLTTVLVESSVTASSDGTEPDHVLESIGDLASVLECR